MKKERIHKIFHKTDGHCHLCGGKCILSHHGVHQTKGGWHIEHSVPRFNGGTDHLNNLYPAHINCNLKKGIKPTRTIRAKHGLSKAPPSKAKKEEIRNENIAAGAVIGGIIGSAFGNSWGTALGVIVGALIGNSNSPS